MSAAYDLTDELAPETAESTLRQLAVKLALQAGFDLADLQTRSRYRRIAYARQAVMAGLYDTGRFSSTQVGKLFGRDHSTVLHAVKLYGRPEGREMPIKAAPPPAPIRERRKRSPVKLWDARAKRELRQLFAEGLSDVEIGQALGRSREAIRKQRSRLGEWRNGQKDRPPVIPEPRRRYSDETHVTRCLSEGGFAVAMLVDGRTVHVRPAMTA